MKERFLLAMSWWAFVHAALVASVFVGFAFGTDVMGDFVKDGYARPLAGGNWEQFALIFSPVVWAVLWIVTGSPRILPWRKL